MGLCSIVVGFGNGVWREGVFGSVSLLICVCMCVLTSVSTNTPGMHVCTRKGRIGFLVDLVSGVVLYCAV